MARTYQLYAAAWFLTFVLWIATFLLLISPIAYWWAIVLVGYAVADWGSYVFHYIVDFYGDVNKEGIVKEFQKHHDDPSGIVLAPMAEVIYPAARIVTPIMLLAWPMVAWEFIPGWLALFTFMLGSGWVFAQVFHRWAHRRERGGPIHWAQQVGLIVSPKSHDAHHVPPFVAKYSVINGWSNWPMDTLKLPRLIDWLLGLFDIRKRAALN